MTHSLLNRLRDISVAAETGASESGLDADLITEWCSSGVKFVCSNETYQARYYQAIRELLMCIAPNGTDRPILQEGGNYAGCWLESTGTINSELLSRFLPSVSKASLEAFADLQRNDGLLPYKITAEGAVFNQIQLVSPPARSVWTHTAINEPDHAFLEKMYSALARYDDWLATHRDTRQTGAVEAFCCHDTGHDHSARFWHIPDKPYLNDPSRYDPNNPRLPFIAPDLTATVYCQRLYLARIAEALGRDAAPWHEKAEASQAALFKQCYDAEDGSFYDRDATGQFVRVQSDVLLRVLAAEIGDNALFDAALAQYLLNTRKFFARYGPTSIALDDPRFDSDFARNSWCGPTNFLSLIRAPHAFELHGRYVELNWLINPALYALFNSNRFPQTISPFTGEAGFTDTYSPAILCLLDFIERLSGILPRPDGTLWFTGLAFTDLENEHISHATGYSRTVAGSTFDLINTDQTTAAYKDGDVLFSAPAGVRIVTNRAGDIQSVIGMRGSTLSGSLETTFGSFALSIGPNEQLDLVDGDWVRARKTSLIAPTT